MSYEDLEHQLNQRQGDSEKEEDDDDLSQELHDLNAQLDETNQALQATKSQSDDLNDTLHELNKLQKALVTSKERFSAAIDLISADAGLYDKLQHFLEVDLEQKQKLAQLVQSSQRMTEDLEQVQEALFLAQGGTGMELVQRMFSQLTDQLHDETSCRTSLESRLSLKQRELAELQLKMTNDKLTRAEQELAILRTSQTNVKNELALGILQKRGQALLMDNENAAVSQTLGLAATDSLSTTDTKHEDGHGRVHLDMLNEEDLVKVIQEKTRLQVMLDSLEAAVVERKANYEDEILRLKENLTASSSSPATPQNERITSSSPFPLTF